MAGHFLRYFNLDIDAINLIWGGGQKRVPKMPKFPQDIGTNTYNFNCDKFASSPRSTSFLHVHNYLHMAKSFTQLFALMPKFSQGIGTNKYTLVMYFKTKFTFLHVHNYLHMR